MYQYPPYTPIANYSYDLLGQLTSATDPTGTYSYSYDTAGNIRTATRNGTSHVYSYENDIWRDLLTSYGISGAEGTAEGTIIYEGQRYNDTGSIVGSPTSGNPISYFNGTRWNFTWQKADSLQRPLPVPMIIQHRSVSPMIWPAFEAARLLGTLHTITPL